jgi:23S rRNA (guanosine2251-2'-O)-methyltransferase
MSIIYGINPVMEALRAGRVRSVRVSRRGGPRLQEIVRRAGAQGVPLVRAEPEDLDRDAGGAAHQGVIGELAEAPDYDVADLVRQARDVPLIVVLDGIEDPQNLGAILRTAEAAGADGVVQQTRRSAPLGPAVARASAGALAHVRIARVVNVARALEELKGAGVWTVGLSGTASERYDAIDLTGPIALVLGAEGTGLRRLVRERCDFLVSIPMRGRVGSLNVSVAAGVALYEALRQRRREEKGPAGTGSGRVR